LDEALFDSLGCDEYRRPCPWNKLDISCLRLDDLHQRVETSRVVSTSFFAIRLLFPFLLIAQIDKKTALFLLLRNYKSLCALRGEEKITAEYAETAELFPCKAKHKSFYGMDSSSPFDLGIKTEDERRVAESAEIIP